MYSLVCYVPESHLDQVKTALFEAGAGRIGAYAECCWQVLGQGQFKPLEGAEPFIGEEGQLELVREYRLEMVVEEQYAVQAVQAMREVHPYEVPAYHLIPVLTVDEA
ncbi:MAG: NGG1p interacting factor NIF3 [Spirochaetae bacterium HGW-Spirochaetae-8]|nr:MAG: NGG1p interacting factor NIF3 [Spirochaetae bacterium HGW-Spirochaetae-8]